MAVTARARRYARAAFEVAVESGDPESWLHQLHQVSAAFANSELRSVLKNPNVPMEQKLSSVQRILPDLQPGVANLVRLLIARQHPDIVAGIAEAFAAYLNQYRGKADASVVSARPLNEDDLTLIRHRLHALTGRTVEVQSLVDPLLIGGIVIRVGDQLIDASVATRLDRLHQRLV